MSFATGPRARPLRRVTGSPGPRESAPSGLTVRLGCILEGRRRLVRRETIRLSARRSIMKPSKCLHRSWGHRPPGHHDDQLRREAGTQPRLLVEWLEDRTVPATDPALGGLPAAPALGSLSAAADSLAAAPTASSAASALGDVSTALQNLTTDLTKT